MRDTDQAKIANVKRLVVKMLDERRILESREPSATPSDYWAGFCDKFDYLLELPERYFAKLRLHTYHLDGDTYQKYFFGDPQHFRRDYDLEAQTRDIPSEYVINEPEGGIGHRFEGGRFVNSNILRFQRVISSLYREGIFNELKGVKDRKIQALEIGAGYGGLSHHLSKLLNNATYFIVDLPETLLFSASYLQLTNPQAALYLYDPETFPSTVSAEQFAQYQYVLIPNYRFQSLDPVQFDLVVNMASLQEMRTRQAEEYLDFVSRHCKVFYSWNEDRQPFNLEMTNVSELIKRRFSAIDITEKHLLIPPPSRDSILPAHLRVLKDVGRAIGLLPPYVPPKLYPSFTLPTYREYICRPLPVG